MTATPQLLHDALVYDDDSEFVDCLVPFVRDGLSRGEGVTAAVTRHNIGLLRDALGPESAAVSFIDRDGWYRRPAATIANWRSVMADAAGRRMRLIGEVAFGGRSTSWTRYEAALNDVFAGAPAWIVCPYDTRALPAQVVADARRTHGGLIAVDGSRRRSPDFVAAASLLRAMPEPMPPVDDPPALVLPLDGDVAGLRHAVRDLVDGRAALGADRLADLLLAVTEVAANSIRYGDGKREARVWLRDRGVICEFTDEGPGIADPLAGYRPPAHGVPGGRGLWIARQLCDTLAVDTSDGVTRVRLVLTD